MGKRLSCQAGKEETARGLKGGMDPKFRAREEGKPQLLTIAPADRVRWQPGQRLSVALCCPLVYSLCLQQSTGEAKESFRPKGSGLYGKHLMGCEESMKRQSQSVM